MKEFINKLIGKFLGECVIYAENYEKALNIANEFAEEYINTSTDTSTTNANRIRSMTDEELAEFFAENCNIGKEFAVCWLQSEVEGATEIKVGDVVTDKEHEVEILVTIIYTTHFDGIKVTADNELGKFGATYSVMSIRDFEKTGKHIDIQSILQQIGGTE